MVIGHLINLNNKKEGDEYREWLQLYVEPPFMGRISATMVENRNKKPNSNEPDYILYENITKRGDKEKFNGKTFRSRIIGGVWKTISKDKKTEFLTASIDTPLIPGGKFKFSMFTAKANVNETAEDVFWLSDAVWNPYTPSSNRNNGYSSNDEYSAPSNYTQGPSGTSIPIHNQAPNDDYEYRG